jgi:class 3 adenylate cyclase
MLNVVFSLFDRLAHKHGLEKIKTIGDAYMVVAGIPEPVADHAVAIAHMALDMLDGIKEYSAHHGTDLSIRIGINTGPVVAGVIGEKKFIYDLWGDTVNTASRMESHGVPGRVHVSSVTYGLLKGVFELEERGPIEIKGKGVMQTYLLIGPLAPRIQPGSPRYPTDDGG